MIFSCHQEMKRITVLIIAVCIMLLGSLLTAWYLHTHPPKGVDHNRLHNNAQPSYYRIPLNGKTNGPSLELNQAMSEAGAQIGLIMSPSYEAAQFVSFESLNEVDDHVRDVKLAPNARYLLGFRGADLMASKSALVYEMRKQLGFAEASKWIPPSYIMSDRGSIRTLLREINNGNQQMVYICKKNIQRQQGARIVRASEVPAVLKDNENEDVPFVVCQRVLQDPMLVNKRKINIRIYMLVILRPSLQANNANQLYHKDAEFWIYKNGFMYYTRKLWEPNTLDPDHIITTGYIDRHVYEKNPLTVQDLRVFMGDASFNTLWGNILLAAEKVKHTYANTFRGANSIVRSDVTQFMIFGMDIAPATDLSVKIMEINKGPDMSYKDVRDKDVKYNLALDTYRLLGMDSHHPQHSLASPNFSRV